jgi:transcriptional regulator with XRE-family HTH domain
VKLVTQSGGPKAGPFAAELERHRQARNLSPAEFARAVGASSSQVSRWRRGGGISIEQLQKIADWMGRPRSDLEPLAGYPASRASSVAAVSDMEDPLLLAIEAAWSGLDQCDKELIWKIALGALSAGSADSNRPHVHGRGAQGTAPHLGRTFTGRDFADLLQRVASPDSGFATDLQRIRAEWRSEPRRRAAW